MIIVLFSASGPMVGTGVQGAWADGWGGVIQGRSKMTMYMLTSLSLLLPYIC